MLNQSVCIQARTISSLSLRTPLTGNQWRKTLTARRRCWLDMLGLWPRPDRTPLKATVTGMLNRSDYVVEKIHFQSVPGAYVPGNLYRPATIKERLPAVLYLCGHSQGKVNPNYQANARWFGQHGYVALILDPIQLGEAQGLHHGTFSQNRWDWFSRGYTPAGTEVWNAMRALDYLETRSDVDASRLGVTGLSGGGAMSWFLGAADERVKCVAPVCQTGSIEQLVVDRATDGHCDCAFWINYQQWCTPDIGALIAPRALLVAAGTEDTLWRPYAFRDVVHRIRRQYAELGVPDNTVLVEDIAPHGYTPKLRREIFRWFNRHLQHSNEPVHDDVTDYVEPATNLQVFGGKLPVKDTMKKIDLLLPRLAGRPRITDRNSWRKHQRAAMAELRRIPFRHIPRTSDTYRLIEYRCDGSNTFNDSHSSYIFSNTEGLTLRVRWVNRAPATKQSPIVACALAPDARSGAYSIGAPPMGNNIATACIEVRNTGATSVGPGYLWTLRRTYPLFGQTLPERQVYDLLTGIAITRREAGHRPIAVYGERYTSVMAIYAALLDEKISEIILASPPESHANPATPALPGILKTGDLPHNLALLYPRPITFIGKIPPAYQWTVRLYQKLGRARLIRTLDSVSRWTPLAAQQAARRGRVGR